MKRGRREGGREGRTGEEQRTAVNTIDSVLSLPCAFSYIVARSFKVSAHVCCHCASCRS